MVYCIEPKGEFRKSLMHILESCGYASEAIPSGKKLLEVLKQHRPRRRLRGNERAGQEKPAEPGLHHSNRKDGRRKYPGLCKPKSAEQERQPSPT